MDDNGFDADIVADFLLPLDAEAGEANDGNSADFGAPSEIESDIEAFTERQATVTESATRSSSGRITGSAVSQPNSGGGSRKDYGDASGRMPNRRRPKSAVLDHPAPSAATPAAG